MKTNDYIGTETEKARWNFPYTGQRVTLVLIRAIAVIKKSAVIANMKAGLIDPERTAAIVDACDEIGVGVLDSAFLLPALQGGAGTSINMNVNEVIALRASEILTGRHINKTVHPLDHVNLSQSTNDVNPSALKISVLQLGHKLLKDLDHMIDVFSEKSREWLHIQKLARTHLQDAVPISLGEEFSSYAAVYERNRDRLQSVLHQCEELNLGGTAVGNMINAPMAYRTAVYDELRKLTGLQLKPSPNFMAQTSSQSDFLAVSQTLVIIALDASKIASDIRLLSSGPNGGIGELQLSELQSGSSIMPGKVNPILPESVNQVYYLVSGNNLSIEQAAHGSQLELGVMFPILADRLLESLRITDEVLMNYTDRCVQTISVNEKRCRELLEASTAYATVLTPQLGYDTLSACVKESLATGNTIRSVVVNKKLLTEEEFDRIIRSEPE